MEDSLVSSVTGQLRYQPRSPELQQVKVNGALPAGPMAAVAALWGSDEPVLGLGNSSERVLEESLKDVQLSGAVASLWGSAEPGCTTSNAGQLPGRGQDAVYAPPQQLNTFAEPVFAPQAGSAQGAYAVPSFPVEPVFQLPRQGVPAAHSPASPAVSGPAAPMPSMRAGQPTAQVVQSPWATAMPQPAGGDNPARGLLMRAAPPPRQQQPPSYGMSTAPMATTSNGQPPAPRVMFSQEEQFLHGTGTTPSGFRHGQSFSRPGLGQAASEAAAASAPGRADGAAAASAAAAAAAGGWPGVRDLGARKAHQVDGDDEDYGRVDLSSFNTEHMVMPSSAEVEFHMKSMLPPPQARDLGAHRSHATQADDLQEMLMMQHLSMEDPEGLGPGQAEPPPSAPPPQLQPQPQVQQALQPEWVLSAPTVARDMKREAHYWKDPLSRADFSGAVDYRAIPKPAPAPPRMQAPPPPPGERVYYEERWDQSVLVEPPGMRGPQGAERTDLGPALGAASLYHGHFAEAGMQGGGPGLQGDARRFPPRAASGLAARLDSVITQLEGHGDAEAAVEDLRDIEASYNAAVNAGRM